jgi:signal transduction histidine kinase
MLANAWFYYSRVSRSELEETADKIVSYIEDGGTVSADKMDELNPNKYVKVVVNERGVKPSKKPEHGFPAPDEQVDEIGNGQYKMGRFNDRQYLYTMRFAKYDEKEYSVQVFREQSTEIGIMRVFLIIFLAVNAFAVLLSVKIGSFISKKMLAPIRDMTETADKISGEDLSGRVEVPEADDEFRTLALTFNNMFDRLENSFERQKRFVSDASHELRTPISVIQGYANLIDRWGKSDTEVLDESISSIKSETEHMSILINQLLFLAREDKGTAAINKEKINIGEIAREAVSETNITNSPEDVVCTFAGNEDAWVFADSHLMKQTMRVIIENAIKYTKAKPCEIRVDITIGGGKVLLSIADNGIGIAEEDLEHIFDRFYRSDKSRNKQIPGNGLGLSIAYTVVKNHNGKIWAESEQGKGSTFFVELDEYND